jgi:hypothetical protein
MIDNNAMVVGDFSSWSIVVAFFVVVRKKSVCLLTSFKVLEKLLHKTDEVQSPSITRAAVGFVEAKRPWIDAP